jgi:hypothetical protein
MEEFPDLFAALPEPINLMVLVIGSLGLWVNVACGPWLDAGET